RLVVLQVVLGLFDVLFFLLDFLVVPLHLGGFGFVVLSAALRHEQRRGQNNPGHGTQTIHHEPPEGEFVSQLCEREQESRVYPTTSSITWPWSRTGIGRPSRLGMRSSGSMPSE